MDNKINVGIIFGGKSGEHDVSLLSAYNVITSIDKNKFDITLIGIDREGVWSIYSGDVENIKNDTWEQDALNNKINFSFTQDEDFTEIDIIFPVLHGTYGEDGTIQGLFEMLDKPYVGCGVLSSSAAMDKDIAKRIFESVGIPVAKGITVYKSDIVNNIDDIVKNIENTFEYPIFVKPANMGSSVGINKARNTDDLVFALQDAAKYDTKILVEEFIDAYEIEIAALGNDNVQMSCPGMIVPCNEFYDYEAKYLTGDSSKIIIPAPISEEKAAEIKFYAAKAFKVMGCSGLSRIDFFLTKDTDKFILNEINTLPGFTNISMYSKLWAASGIEYTELITKLIDLGFERYNTRKELQFIK